MSYDAPPPPPAQGGYGAVPQNHPKAQTAMILGIVGLVCCGPVGIAAFIMGNNAVKEIDASGGRLGGRGMAQAGKIMGIIAIVLMVLGIILYAILFATGAMSVSTSSSGF